MPYCHMNRRSVVQWRILAGCGATIHYPHRNYERCLKLALALNERTYQRAAAWHREHQKRWEQ